MNKAKKVIGEYVLDRQNFDLRYFSGVYDGYESIFNMLSVQCLASHENTIIDIGCSSGFQGLSALEHHLNYIGIDKDAEGLLDVNEDLAAKVIADARHIKIYDYDNEVLKDFQLNFELVAKDIRQLDIKDFMRERNLDFDNTIVIAAYVPCFKNHHADYAPSLKQQICEAVDRVIFL